MRCARCDRLAVPQAVGYTAGGHVVFGWCLACLEETGCRDVEVARPSSRPSTRLVLTAPRRRRALDRPAPADPGPRRFDPLDDRRRVVAAVALVLSLWGVAVFLVGLSLAARESADPARPAGSGTPAFLIGGGGTTAAVGFTLWALIYGRRLVRSRHRFAVLKAVGFAVGIGTLALGIVFRSPRYDPLIVGVSALGLTVSFAARMAELRRARALAGSGR